MIAKAFAPGHISGFFEPVFYLEDLIRTGSRGAGVSISLGALSEVIVEESQKGGIQIFINGKKSPAPVTNLALKYIIGNNPLNVVVKTHLDLPIGQGFGMSAAGALSSCLAICKSLGLSSEDALKAAHMTEVQLRTGLGDVISSFFGGLEIRKSPGLPPWGLIEHIPGQFELVLCVIGKKIDTKKVLDNPALVRKISEYGRLCTKKLLENPSIENFCYQSQIFTKKTGLADKKTLQAIDSVKNLGVASMCMLGNSIFASGKTEKLCRVLSVFGKVYVCCIDEYGARILEE
ncbi:MAG: pantoate kinase [Candidatus Thermoplasmatota archaeon]|nr:pantoate kinase [Candidatus Thermoplasmatota archaeon]